MGKPLTSKDAFEVSIAFQTIYEGGTLRWPKVLQVDPGHVSSWVMSQERLKSMM